MALKRISVNGKNLIDSSGNTIKLTGIGLDASMVAQKYCAWGRDLHVDLMKQYGVKCVRIFVTFGWWRRGFEYSFDIDPEDYKAGIDRIVAELNANDIYCWINLEGSYEDQTNWGIDAEQWKAFVLEVVQRYNGYSNFLGVEPQNEPHIDYWGGNYYAHLSQVAEAVYQFDPKLIVFADTPIHSWREFDSNFPLPQKNIVYCYHLYQRWLRPEILDYYISGDFETAKANLEAFLIEKLYWLHEQGYPVMDTEFAIARDEYHPNGDAFLQHYFDIMKKHGIHWMYFHWDDDSTGLRYDVWQTWGTPTIHGQIVFDNLLPLIMEDITPNGGSEVNAVLLLPLLALLLMLLVALRRS